MEKYGLSKLEKVSTQSELVSKNNEELMNYGIDLQNEYRKLSVAVTVLKECSGIELPDEEIETVMSFYGKSFLVIYRYINKLEEYILNKKELLKGIVVRGQEK